MKFKNLHFLCILLFGLSFTNSFSQNESKSINGRVIDENGMSLVGANVNVKGSNTSARTGFDGSYKIKANANDALVISYIGYKSKEELVGDRINITTKLFINAPNALNEVVVVGYGTQKKALVTGSISKIKAKDFEDQPITRIEQVLQGRASGVFVTQQSGKPGAASSIRIRGTTTIGANEPLWVVDGILVDNGGIQYLNPADIESSEVLKDAAAQAIYGTRAANGVILVTTKSGKAGKIKIAYSGFSGVSAPARKIDLLNAQQYATLFNESDVANGFPKRFTGAQDPSNLGAGTDWQKAIFNDHAFRQSHNLSLSGANEVSSFYLSFGLLDQQGIVSSSISNYIRKTLRLNSNHKISKYITVGETLSYSNEKTQNIGNTNNSFGGPLSSAVNLDPLTPVVSTILDPINTIPNVIRDENGNPYSISKYVGNEITNPVAYPKKQLGNYDWADNFVGNAYAEITPIEGLKFKSTIAAKLAYYGNVSFTPLFYLNTTNVRLQNEYFSSVNKSFGWNIENVATYTKKIKGHNISLLLGQGTYIDDIGFDSGVSKFGIGATNFNDASPNFEVPEAQIKAYSSIKDTHKVTSLFSRLTYDYKERYLLTGVIRRDGSSRFGVNHKFGIFPSFSAGWVVSNESFWKQNDIINQLKFRGGYGVVGNDRFDNFRYISLVGGGYNTNFGTGGNVLIGSAPTAPANPDLKWEETSQSNIAIDIAFLKNFNFTFDMYNKNTTGILRRNPLAGFFGANDAPFANVGSMTNKGFEIELGYRKKVGELNVSLGANLSYVKNEVTGLENGIKYIDGGSTVQSTTFPITRTAVGQPIDSFFGFKTQGIFQNQAEIDAYKNADGGLIQPDAKPGDFRWQDTDGDGKITADDRTFLGKALPDYTYGFTVNLEYKNFDLSVFGQGVIGNKVYQGLRRLDLPNANFQTDALTRWTGEGTSNTYPRFALGAADTNKNFSNPSDFNLQKADFLRIRTIQLGYSIPTAVSKLAGIQKVRFYVTGENLFTFTKYTGFNPEIGGGNDPGNSGAESGIGIDKGVYPQAKSYLFGINLQF